VSSWINTKETKRRFQGDWKRGEFAADGIADNFHFIKKLHTGKSVFSMVYALVHLSRPPYF